MSSFLFSLDFNGKIKNSFYIGSYILPHQYNAKLILILIFLQVTLPYIIRRPYNFERKFFYRDFFICSNKKGPLAQNSRWSYLYAMNSIKLFVIIGTNFKESLWMCTYRTDLGSICSFTYIAAV